MDKYTIVLLDFLIDKTWVVSTKGRIMKNKSDLNGHTTRVEQYLPLVHKIAARVAATYPTSAVFDIRDLINEGVVGLMQADNKFNDQLGVDFSVYARRR